MHEQAPKNDTPKAANQFSDVVVPAEPDEIRARLDIAARRGRLPGLHVGSGSVLFYVDGCGTPFEHHLIGHGSPEGSGTRIAFTLERQRRMPLIFIVLLIVTVWPGVYFMDQLIPGEWNWIKTEYWYLPLTILPIPWFWRSTARKSLKVATEDAIGLIDKIRAEFHGAA